MPLQDKEKQLLRQLVHTATWQVMLRVAEELDKEINGIPIIGETVDETLKNVYLREGKKEAIKDYLQKLIDNANA